MSITLLKSILQGYLYPTELAHSAIARMKAEIHSNDKKVSEYAINSMRMAIIKAYLLRNTHYTREMITVSLNPDWKDTAYLLGRLFAICEKIQDDASSGNTTIKERYFSSASTTPASIFPSVIKLAHVYLPKIDKPPFRITREKQLGDVMNMLEAKPFPKNLPFEEQNVFILGYYHQMKAFFTKNTNIDEENNNAD